jgi:hypothetical protein
VNVFFLLAGSAALAVLATHVIVGGRLFVRPLLASKQLHRVTRLTLYYCWHLTTLLIAAIAALYLYAAATPEGPMPAVIATALAAGASALSLLIVVRHRQRPWHMPQWLFFAIVAALGVVGLAQ